MIFPEIKEKRRIIQTYQDSTCQTGDVKLVDEEGRIWVRSLDDNETTGVVKGVSNGVVIWVNK